MVPLRAAIQVLAGGHTVVLHKGLSRHLGFITHGHVEGGSEATDGRTSWARPWWGAHPPTHFPWAAPSMRPSAFRELGDWIPGVRQLLSRPRDPGILGGPTLSWLPWWSSVGLQRTLCATAWPELTVPHLLTWCLRTPPSRWRLLMFWCFCLEEVWGPQDSQDSSLFP